VDLLILDELREHRDWAAWGALSKTTLARPGALIVCISNAGDDESVVLNQLRSAALAGTDDQLGLFEWSAPDGCELDDPEAWAQSMPGLGITITESAVRSALATDPPAVFRTELLCQRVEALDSAVDLAAWQASADPSAPNLGAVRDRVAVCLDVAPDGQHVTLAGAAVLPDGRVRVEVIAAWESTEAARGDLGPLYDRLRPAGRGWFPSGPAAALAPELRPVPEAPDPYAARRRRRPAGEGLHVEITGSAVGEACQGFAELVRSGRVVHPDDPLLNAHVAGSSKLHTGDGWRFARRGAGHVDAAYAAAGAVHIARTLPEPERVPRSAIY
jgi:phage terminase large subunit-like protein